MFHSCFYSWAQSPSPLRRCYLFVDFFFILSGFVITHSYVQRIRDGLSFRTYLQLRLGRIFPLHAAVMVWLLGYAVVASTLYVQRPEIADASRATSPITFLTHFFLLSSFGAHEEIYWNVPSWSISGEMGAYIAFFFFASTFGRYFLGRVSWVLVPLVVSIALYAHLLSRYPSELLGLTFQAGFLRCVAGFSLGVALWRLREAMPWLHALPSRMLALLESAVVAAVAASLWRLGEGRRWYVVFLIAAFAGSILAFTNENDGPIGRALKLGLPQKVGLWSYSIYMIHYPLIIMILDFIVLDVAQPRMRLSDLGLTGIVLNLVLLGMVIALARLSFERLEVPSREWAKTRAFKQEHRRSA